MKLLRVLALIVLVMALPSCNDTPSQPSQPTTTTTTTLLSTPAIVTATLTVGNANAGAIAGADLFEGPAGYNMWARFDVAWANTGGTGAVISNPRIEIVHDGGLTVTEPISLGATTRVDPGIRLTATYDYKWTADEGSANLGITSARALSDWQDAANNLSGTANTDPVDVPETSLARDTDPCSPGDTTMCLQNGRFRVEVDWTSTTASGTGSVLSSGLDTGNFYFFNPSNSDLLVQLLDRCSTNDHYWVFASATTNVEFTMTVADTSTGETRTYFNPNQGVVPPPITDTDAFATCPVPLPIPEPNN